MNPIKTIKNYLATKKLAKQSKENLDKAFENNNKTMEVLKEALKKYDK